MSYDIKDYVEKFGGGSNTSLKNKVQADKDMGLASIIIRLLNKNKYDSLEDFIKRNNTYQDFLKNNNTDVVVQHFGNFNKHKITEEDFVRVLNNLRELTKTKNEFETENIKTTNIDDKQYNSFKGEDKTYFIDNSRTDKSIEDQMKDLQPTEQDFQTTDQKKNTENMFKELERKKEGLNLNYLHEINYDLLNNEQKELFQIADDYQQNNQGVIRVDLEKSIIVDELDNFIEIEKNNGEFAVIKDGDVVEKESVKEKTLQKTLTPSRNTIYSN